MKKIISIFITIAIVFQLTNALAVDRDWSLKEFPDLSETVSKDIIIRFDRQNGQFERRAFNMPSEMAEEIKNLIVNFN